jgi:predicted acyl esterase
VLVTLVVLSGTSASGESTAVVSQGTLPDGAVWLARIPAQWNGTLLLYSHGYQPALRPPELASRESESWLLSQGYALLASSYAKPGWALAEAVPDQLAALGAFTARIGKPRQTIAWGESMGALVTIALAEQSPDRIDGALALCGSLAGSVGMMNEALDGAFAFKTLLPETQAVQLVHVADDRANAQRVQALVGAAMKSPQGRARIALAGVLAQIPSWTVPGSSAPAPEDAAAQLEQMANAFAQGVFLPRTDQEARARGSFSWNLRVDYRKQLARTGRREWVARWYEQAGLNLDEDLARLDASARVTAAPEAVAYMRAHYVPSGELRIPVLSAHTLGDGLTVPTQQEAYRAAVEAAGHAEQLATSWVQRAGHCQFTTAEKAALLQTLRERMSGQPWHSSAAQLNVRAQRTGLGESAFVEHRSAEFLRPYPALQPAIGAETSAATGAAKYDGVLVSSEYVQAPDGTRLAISVHRPTRDGLPGNDPLPVIVTQDRSEPDAEAHMRYFTDRGYVWVSQDRRGTGASFGVQVGFVTAADLSDARAVIQWAGSQPFSNRRVVTLGCSNQGIWQYGVAALHPKYLVAIAPACSSPQLFDHGIAMNGVPMFALRDKPYAGQCAGPDAGAPPGTPAVPSRPVDSDPQGVLLAAALKAHGCDAPFLGQYWLNMPRDGYDAFAHARPGIDDTPISRASAIQRSGVAILQLGGWYDAAVAGQLEGHRLWGGALVLGPWVHGNHPAPGTDVPDADRDLDGATLRWFDHFAKGVANGAEQQGITYYLRHAPAGSEWRNTGTWPPAGQHLQPYYLRADGLAAQRPSPSAEPARYAGREVRWFDGKYQPLARAWGGDMSTADLAGLAHTSAPLAADLALVGTPVAHLWVSADVPDFNVFAVLEDVDGAGHSSYITDGRLRASWRALHRPPWGDSRESWHQGFARDLAPVTVGVPTELVFDFFPTAYVVAAGHRLRVTLVTSLGEPWQDPPGLQGKPANLTLYRDAEHASWVALPILEKGS